MKRWIDIILVLLVTRVTAQTDCTTVYSRKTGQPNLFVYSLQPKGFVIVSALDEVLAYSHESEFPSLDSLPENIAYWIDLYNEQTDYLIQHPGLSRHESKSQQSVKPLLTSQWAQNCYYNEACPFDNTGPCQHATAGCVAVAMAQIMYYYKYPVTGSGSNSYYCPPYGTLSANFGQTIYRWDDMVDQLSESNTAVAQLISHCGISVGMHYSPHGSGSSIDDAFNAFRSYFLYSTASFALRSQCTDEKWMAYIRNNLDKGAPVFYAGLSNEEGHAFVCDGYDSNGFFHFNFGWNGVADGYYSLNNPQGYSTEQRIIHDLYPTVQIPISSDPHGIIYVAADGIGDGSSWEKATNNLQLAIYKSQMDDCSIWVKEGTYTRPGNDHMLYIHQSCKLYGGFKGDEPYDYDLTLRDFTNHPSVLDGGQAQGLIEVNAYGQDILIDGFTIQNGKASNGGGIDLQGGIVQINNCTFHHNQASYYGGAIQDYCGATYRCCQFHNNYARRSGGAIAVFKRKSYFWSCLISNNTSKSGGGCYYESEVDLLNCTIVRNEAQEDYGGIYQNPSFKSVNIRNCILWGNTSQGDYPQLGPDVNYSYCAVEDDQSIIGTNYNIPSENDGKDPAFYVRFNNPTAMAGFEAQGGDWGLQSNSLCIDRVHDIANQPDTDLAGHPRHRHNKVDLGAYESDVVTNTLSAFLCDGDPYYYQDSLISALGYYTFLFPGIPYDSLVVVEMQTPPDTIVLSERICGNDTYDFCGRILDTEGHYSAFCNCSFFELDLSIAPPFESPCSPDPDDITLYPNPAHNIINVYMPLIDEVELLNRFGERIYHTQAAREPVTMDISKIPNGVYIVHVNALFKHYYKTLVVCH